MTYSDGSKYVGKWKKGVRNGEGKLILKSNGKDSIVHGIWKDGNYFGKIKLKQYEVIRKSAVPRYRIKKVGDTYNRVTIEVKNNNSTFSMTTSNLFGSNGNLTFNQGDAIFEDINVFPFTCEMRYVMVSKTGWAGSSPYDVEFIFKIFEKGDWLVVINH